MTPYLSVVAASRNDDHGGNTLYRTQIFIDSLLEQCERHQLEAELVLVEWNPPANRPRLAEIIDWSRQNPWVNCRVITVPYERHILLRFARELPLFQMIAKNVGIRRAWGQFILATNIDILFSDELMAFIAKKKLRSDRQYRCDRFDIDSKIPKDVSLDEKLQFARENLIRRNYRMRPPEIATPQAEGASPEITIQAALQTGRFELETEEKTSILTAKSDIPSLWLHIDACGDFALLHRDAWATMRGYAEFEIYSLNIDFLGVAIAHNWGFREAWLPPPAVCYHIEHALGSGFTPEDQAPLFDRMERQGISWFDHEVIHSLLAEQQPCHFNKETWGMRDIPLDETICTREKCETYKVPNSQQADRYAPVSALDVQYGADQHFRKAIQQLNKELQNHLRAFDNERAQFHAWVNALHQGLDGANAQIKVLESQLKEAEMKHRLSLTNRCREFVKKIIARTKIFRNVA